MILVLLCIPAVTPAAAPALRGQDHAVLDHVADVPLPGPAARFDYQSIDTTANRLYVSHMNAGRVLVVDLAGRRVVGTIDDLPRVTGVWCVPALGKVYASVTGRHEVAVIDAHTLKVVARVGGIGFPDGIAYAPEVHRIYVSDESGGGELVIDGRTNRRLATIALGGEAGNSVYDPGSGRILVAVQTRNELVQIDPRRDSVVSRHPLKGAALPHGLSVDAAGRRLFVANEENATLLLVNLRTLRVAGRYPIGEDPDVLAFDPVEGRLYVGAESGTVTVFSTGKGGLVEEGRMVIPHGHTVSVDLRTHLVYFPLQDVSGCPVLRIMEPRTLDLPGRQISDGARHHDGPRLTR